MAALDTADHNILFKKLSQSGIRGKKNKKDSHSGFFPRGNTRGSKSMILGPMILMSTLRNFNIPGGYLISWQ